MLDPRTRPASQQHNSLNEGTGSAVITILCALSAVMMSHVHRSCSRGTSSSRLGSVEPLTQSTFGLVAPCRHNVHCMLACGIPKAAGRRCIAPVRAEAAGNSTPKPKGNPPGTPADDDDPHPVKGVGSKGGGLYAPKLWLPDNSMASIKGLGGALSLRDAALAANELYKRNGREPPNTPAVLQAMEEWLARHPSEDLKKDDHPVRGVARKGIQKYAPILRLPGERKASTKGIGGARNLREAALAANELYRRNGLAPPNTPQVMQELEEWLARHPNEDPDRTPLP